MARPAARTSRAPCLDRRAKNRAPPSRRRNLVAMLLNEPTAALRVLSVRLLATGGAGLLPGHSWAPGEVLVRRPGTVGGAFVAAVNAPVAITGGSDGSFDLQLDLAEVAAEGIGRVQFAPAGGQFAEATYEVMAHALELVLDPLVTAGKGRTASECINIAAAYAAGDARGLDGPVGSIDSLADDPAQRVKRVEFSVQSGKRTITARRG